MKIGSSFTSLSQEETEGGQRRVGAPMVGGGGCEADVKGQVPGMELPGGSGPGPECLHTSHLGHFTQQG